MKQELINDYDNLIDYIATEEADELQQNIREEELIQDLHEEFMWYKHEDYMLYLLSENK